MRKLRNFLARCEAGRYWLIEESWCEACGEADLGLSDPVEYEENGARYIEGKCMSCRTTVRSVILEIDLPPER